MKLVRTLALTSLAVLAAASISACKQNAATNTAENAVGTAENTVAAAANEVTNAVTNEAAPATNAPASNTP